MIVYTLVSLRSKAPDIILVYSYDNPISAPVILRSSKAFLECRLTNALS